jgi:hypothetical protein
MEKIKEIKLSTINEIRNTFNETHKNLEDIYKQLNTIKPMLIRNLNLTIFKYVQLLNGNEDENPVSELNVTLNFGEDEDFIKINDNKVYQLYVKTKTESYIQFETGLQNFNDQNITTIMTVYNCIYDRLSKLFVENKKLIINDVFNKNWMEIESLVQ